MRPRTTSSADTAPNRPSPPRTSREAFAEGPMRHRDPVLRSVSDSSGGFDWRPAGHGSYRRVDSFGANRYTREASSSGNLSSPRRASNQACVAASVAALQDLKVAEQQVTACDEVKVDVSQSPQQSVVGSQSPQQSVEAGTGTPAATQPNTALGSPRVGCSHPSSSASSSSPRSARWPTPTCRRCAGTADRSQRGGPQGPAPLRSPAPLAGTGYGSDPYPVSCCRGLTPIHPHG